MSITPEHVVAVTQAQLNATLTLAKVTLASVEHLVALNLGVARSLVDESVANAKAIASAQDAQELIALQTPQAQPLIEKAVAYARGAYAITSEGRDKLAEVLESQIAEIGKEAAAALDMAARSAPMGYGEFFAACQSGIASANLAFDSMLKAAKQATEMAEATLAATSDTTLSAVNKAASPKVKKAA